MSCLVIQFNFNAVVCVLTNRWFTQAWRFGICTITWLTCKVFTVNCRDTFGCDTCTIFHLVRCYRKLAAVWANRDATVCWRCPATILVLRNRYGCWSVLSFWSVSHFNFRCFLWNRHTDCSVSIWSHNWLVWDNCDRYWGFYTLTSKFSWYIIALTISGHNGLRHFSDMVSTWFVSILPCMSRTIREAFCVWCWFHIFRSVFWKRATFMRINTWSWVLCHCVHCWCHVLGRNVWYRYTITWVSDLDTWKSFADFYLSWLVFPTQTIVAVCCYILAQVIICNILTIFLHDSFGAWLR